MMTLGEAVAPIVRRAAVRAFCDPEMSSEALFCIGDALDELGHHIAVTAGPISDEPMRLAHVALFVRSVAAARAATLSR